MNNWQIRKSERDKMSKEKLFSLGINKDAYIISHIPPEELGLLTADSLDTIRCMLLDSYSIVDVMRKYKISRDTVYKILEVPAPSCLQTVVIETTPHHYRRLSQDEINGIIRDYQSRKVKKQKLAELYDTTYQTVHRILHNAGIPMIDERVENRKSLARRLNEREKDMIISLYDSGLTNPAEIAKRISSGTTINQVRRLLKLAKK